MIGLFEAASVKCPSVRKRSFSSYCIITRVILGLKCKNKILFKKKIKYGME